MTSEGLVILFFYATAIVVVGGIFNAGFTFSISYQTGMLSLYND
jgi:hypothetical protein